MATCLRAYVYRGPAKFSTDMFGTALSCSTSGNPISTLCCGQAASMASLLLAAGEKGHRQSLPNSRIMMHQPSGGYQVLAGSHY